MVNSNPETVSTDYDTSDMLFFEPLTHEDVLNICRESFNGTAAGGTPGRPAQGVIVQFGGQTPLNLARGLETPGVPIIGTSLDSIDLAEDRKRFAEVLTDLKLRRPAERHGLHRRGGPPGRRQDRLPGAGAAQLRAGRPGMEIVSDEEQLDDYMAKAVDASTVGHDHPILIDGSWTTPPRWTWTASPTSARRPAAGGTPSQSPRGRLRRDGAHRGGGHPLAATRPARCRRTRCRPRSSRRSSASRAAGQAADGPRADERAVRRQGRRRCTCWRSTRGPAGRCRSSPRPPACRGPSWRPR